MLGPNNLLQLVSTIIAKDMKRTLMTLLNRLKEECVKEAELLFSEETVLFDASGAVLICMLVMLAEHVYV